MLVTMSDKEIHRLPVIQAVCEKRLRRRDAASQLGISERQAQRLINRYRVSGAEGLVSRKRGQPSNRRLTESLKMRVLTLIRENYSDFGPTLAAEKLRERHNIRLSIETVRNWMTSDGIWIPHARRKSRVYQPRHRRDCLGELIQIDGSHHDWFEGRAPKCCLAVLPVKKLKYWIIPMAPSPSTMGTEALSARHLISWPVSARGRLLITNVSGLYSDWLR